MFLTVRELLGSHAQFFARTSHASSDQYAAGFLPHHHARDGHALISLIFVPCDQLVLMKLRLRRNVLLHLEHVYTTFLL
jgi:hypothetical protein